MDKIRNFKYIVLTNSDEGKNIEEQLSVFDTLPKIVSWHCNEVIYKIENEHKIIAFFLEKENQIAIIESPFNKEYNKAYIVDCCGKNVMNISSLFKEKYNSLFYNKSIIFTDVYYSNKALSFFLVANNIDFRVKIDIDRGLIGDLIESR